MALFAAYSYATLSVVLQTAAHRIYTLLPKMDSNLSAKDIFLWADGYWCFREEFYQQLRQAYSYRLLQVGTADWHAVRGGYPLGLTSRPQPRNRAASESIRT